MADSLYQLLPLLLLLFICLCTFKSLQDFTLLASQNFLKFIRDVRANAPIISLPHSFLFMDCFVLPMHVSPSTQ